MDQPTPTYRADELPDAGLAGFPALASALAAAQAHRLKTGRPLVTLSYAQSLDGSITARRGQPLALSGPAAQVFTHRLRAGHSAILVGIGTVLADDPRLTVRLVDGPDPQPVVLDGSLRCPPHARLLHGTRPPWIATTSQADPARRAALQAAGAHLLELPEAEAGRIHLPALLAVLAGLGMNSLMVEGGARVITSFLARRLVDWVALTVVPQFTGGLPAVEASLEQPGGAHNRFPRLEGVQSTQLGEDWILCGKFALANQSVNSSASKTDR